jgi:putative endonuclease
MIWLTKFVVRSIELAGVRFRSRRPKHLLTGKQGEIEAYLHLRAVGYRIVAANFRVPYNRGEIDLIGWDNGVLCFIEVKTRTSADFAPPSTAVDPNKRKHIRSVARQYLRRLPVDRPPPCRFDIVSIVLGDAGSKPAITVHKGAFSWDAGRPRRSWRRDFRDPHFWRRTR